MKRKHFYSLPKRTVTIIILFRRIKISFNVNHSVDTDAEPELQENLDKPEIGELKSKPSFRIDLVRGNTTVTLSCSFINPNDQEEGYSKCDG